MPEIVIEAAHSLSKGINQQEALQHLITLEILKWVWEEYAKVTVESLDRKTLLTKVDIELGKVTFV